VGRLELQFNQVKVEKSYCLVSIFAIPKFPDLNAANPQSADFDPFYASSTFYHVLVLFFFKNRYQRFEKYFC